MPMKDVVTGAPIRQTILVTGFGAFPDARRNPTLAILAGLARHRPRLARLGIALRCVALPVVYDAIEPALRDAIGAQGVDAILHLGLAGRRRVLTIETRALNRAGPLHPDAARRLPAPTLVRGAPHVLRATYPAARVRAALSRAGHDARSSIDAGDYVCNATLYRSLAACRAPSIGFIHVPRAKERRPLARERDERPSPSAMTSAVLAAVLVVARHRLAVDAPARAR